MHPCKRRTYVEFLRKTMMNYLTRDQFVKAMNNADKGEEPFLKEFGNTGGVSNDLLDESGVLHGVSERNATRSSMDDDSESFGGFTLANRTDDGNKCPNCDNPKTFEYFKNRYCDYCHTEF